MDDQIGIVAGGGATEPFAGIGVEGRLGIVMEQCDEWERS